MEIRPICLPRTARDKLLIAGPCSAESERQVLDTAHQLAAMGVRMFRAGLGMPRTRPGTFEGVGEAGLPWLARVKDETGMMTATEVANAEHVHLALDAGVDMVWIGTRTSTNPFAVQEIADALRGKDVTVLVKNPITPDTALWAGAIERIWNAGIRNIGAIHRGFGAYGQMTYRNRPQWDIPLELHGRLPGLSIICDPSHIAGDRRLVQELCQQAMDLNMDGLIVEVHADPSNAKSDAKQQLTPDELGQIIDALVINDAAGKGDEQINILRAKIDEIDNNLIDSLARRMEVVAEIGKCKKAQGLTVLQTERYNAVLAKWREMGARRGLPEDFIGHIYEIIHSEAVARQFEAGKEGAR